MPRRPRVLSAYYTRADGNPDEMSARADDDDELDALTAPPVHGEHVISESIARDVVEFDRLISRPRYDFVRASPPARAVVTLRFVRATPRAVDDARVFPWQVGDTLRLFDRHSHALIMRATLVGIGAGANAHASGTVTVVQQDV
jgi:hypothetical protein